MLFHHTNDGLQFPSLLSQYYVARYGGTVEGWSAANADAYRRFTDSYRETFWGGKEADYNEFIEREYALILTRMFEAVGIDPPPEDERFRIQVEATRWIHHRINASIPGVPEAVHRLADAGFRLYTCSGLDSWVIEAKLQAMNIAHRFRGLYGPDLVNCAKEGALYYETIFADAGENVGDVIVLDDKPAILRWARDAGAACLLIGKRADDGFDSISNYADLPGYLGL